MELQAADGLIALSGHTWMYFLTLRDIFLQTLHLKLSKWLKAETSLHKKRTALDNLREKRTVSGPSSYSQALPSSPPAPQSWPRSSLTPSSAHGPLKCLTMTNRIGTSSSEDISKSSTCGRAGWRGLARNTRHLALMHLSCLSIMEKSFFSPSGFILTLLAFHFTIKKTHWPLRKSSAILKVCTCQSHW